MLSDRRIRRSAIRRAGELLKQIEPQQGANQNIGAASDTKVLTRKGAAEQAGMSRRQAVTAIRVTNIPEKEFEARAKMRLAEEYDAAQEAGDVQKPGGDRKSINVFKQNNDLPTVSEIGLSRKEIHEARVRRALTVR